MFSLTIFWFLFVSWALPPSSPHLEERHRMRCRVAVVITARQTLRYPLFKECRLLSKLHAVLHGKWDKATASGASTRTGRQDTGNVNGGSLRTGSDSRRWLLRTPLVGLLLHRAIRYFERWYPGGCSSDSISTEGCAAMSNKKFALFRSASPLPVGIPSSPSTAMS